MKIAFDVDGTLIDKDGRERVKVTRLMALLSPHNEIYVWSWARIVHAQRVCRRLKLMDYIDDFITKPGTPAVRWGNSDMDLCYDDMDVRLARINIRV